MNIRIALLAAALVLCCSCTSVTPFFALHEDPSRIDFEKPKAKSLTTTLGGMSCLTVWDMKDDEVLCSLGDLGRPPHIEKQWLRAGKSKYFKVGDREYVFTVVDADDGQEEKHRAVFEISSWDNFQSRCHKGSEGEGVFTFGAF